jgi:methylisocitrate lyase
MQIAARAHGRRAHEGGIVKTLAASEVLRQLLDRPAILELPAVCDPLGARLARDAGYEAVALAGYAIAAHLPLGSTFSIEAVERAACAAIRACGVPLLLDADAGLAAAGRLGRDVARLEAAGVAAIQVSSQHVPDRAPVRLASERQRAHAGLLRRVETACAVRDHILVMARCDILPGPGYAESAGRAAALLAAGADAILVHAAESGLRRLAKDLPGARLIYTGPLTASCGQSVFPADRLEQWGYSGLSNKYHRCYCPRLRPAVPGAAETLPRGAADIPFRPCRTPRRADQGRTA